MSGGKRVIIVEDHTIVREGLRYIINSVPGYQVVAEAGDGFAALDLVKKEKPDLALMDLSMPKMNGFEATREIKALNPGTRVLILTVHGDEEHVMEAFDAGADGYVLKNAPKDELLLALDSVCKDKFFVSPSVSDRVIDGLAGRLLPLKGRKSSRSLTARERQILKLIAEGYSNTGIANMLCISIKTVETHRSKLMKKLGAHNVQELTVYAMRKGLIT